MRASIIVPVHDGAGTIAQSLRALLRVARSDDEILVVDDRSTDDSSEIAAGLGVRVCRLPEGRRGAAAARNLGASVARGRFLVFVDADVVLDPGSLAQLLGPLEDGVASAVGVYRPGPPGLGAWSRTKDLSVRMNHAAAGARIRWFWTAIGAVRAEVFHQLGGFDARRFTGATVEDMAFGFRMSEAGHTIVQVSAATAVHLHRFGGAGALANDYRKARDWARLLAGDEHRRAGSHGATGRSEALGLASALLLFLGGASVFWNPLGFVAAGAGLGGLAWALREHLREARREGGMGRVLEYLACRAILYPVAALGALVGLVGPSASLKHDPAEDHRHP